MDLDRAMMPLRLARAEVYGHEYIDLPAVDHCANYHTRMRAAATHWLPRTTIDDLIHERG